jgi:hypothetical protein
MLGSLAKCALERGASRDENFTGNTTEEVAAVIRKELKEETKMFAGIEVVVVPRIERPEEQVGAKIPGISKMRHVSLTAATGQLLAREVGCLTCCETKGSLCATCTALPQSYPRLPRGRKAATAVPNTQAQENAEQEGPEEEAEVTEGDDAHLDEPLEDPFNLLTDADRADAEEEDEGVVAALQGEEQAAPGEIVWVKERRGCFWPAQALPYSMVPLEARRHSSAGGENVTWVKMFATGQYRPFPPWLIKPFLGNTVFDVEARGSDPDRVAAFDLAIHAKSGF